MKVFGKFLSVGVVVSALGVCGMSGVNSSYAAPGDDKENNITFIVGGSVKSVSSDASTVREAVYDTFPDLKRSAVVSPSLDTKISSDTDVNIDVFEYSRSHLDSPIPFTTKRVEDKNLEKGIEKVVTKGEDGVLSREWSNVTKNGEVVSVQVVSESVKKKPVEEVIVVGTKEEIKPVRVAGSVNSPSSRDSFGTSQDSHISQGTETSQNSQGSGDMSRSVDGNSRVGNGSERKNLTPVSPEEVAVWDRIAKCESDNRWDINTGNSFSGGLQFTKSTWREFGGQEFAPEAYLASKEEQIEVAKRVQKVQGWKAWPACTKKIGIRK